MKCQKCEFENHEEIEFNFLEMHQGICIKGEPNNEMPKMFD
jgi:hypothetical protein